MELFTLPLQILFFGGVLAAMAMILYRLVYGPHIVDRLICVDALVLLIICLIAGFKIVVQTRWFFDAILALAIIGFISTVAFAKYLESGGLIEHDD
jgi:multicomponent Na+:H+ antiporter subunit F